METHQGCQVTTGEWVHRSKPSWRHSGVRTEIVVKGNRLGGAPIAEEHPEGSGGRVFLIQIHDLRQAGPDPGNTLIPSGQTLALASELQCLLKRRLPVLAEKQILAFPPQINSIALFQNGPSQTGAPPLPGCHVPAPVSLGTPVLHGGANRQRDHRRQVRKLLLGLVGLPRLIGASQARTSDGHQRAFIKASRNLSVRWGMFDPSQVRSNRLPPTAPDPGPRTCREDRVLLIVPMSSGRLFLDRVGRHQSPSPLRRHAQINMRLKNAPLKPELSTLLESGTFYFALTNGERVVGRERHSDTIAVSGCGAAWLARLLGVQEVPGSNPGSPTNPFKDLRTNPSSRGLFWSPSGVQTLYFRPRFPRYLADYPPRVQHGA